jgi:hypothetical protein
MQLAASRASLTNNNNDGGKTENEFARIDTRLEIIESKAATLNEVLMAQVTTKYEERISALE